MTSDTDLLAMARHAAATAYAPYSGFRVGAALIAEDGSIHTGANVENAAYPSTLCAEAVAIGKAVSSGVLRITTVAVACLDVEQCFPCGQCRQRMREFRVQRIVVQDGSGGAKAYAFSELLPHAFGPESLAAD